MKALELADQEKLSTIAFPPLGIGPFGFNTHVSATVMFRAIKEYVTKHSKSSLEIVRIVINTIRQVNLFKRVMVANDF